MGAGPLALTCWSAKPIHIGDCGLMRPAYGRPAALATCRGRPFCWNISRGVWKENSPLNCGEATDLPFRLLLPATQAAMLASRFEESLRSVKSTSLDSIWTRTLNLSFVALGTSVGLATASSRTDRPVLLASFGMWELTSVEFRRRKYGRPY